jgi:tetratricopeptide (TPR) repeat protein
MVDQKEIPEILELAQRATTDRNWPEACRYWDCLRSCSELGVADYLGAATALRESGRFDDAEQALAEAAERFNDDQQIALARAWLANARGDWTTAVSRWASLRERLPENPWYYAGSIHALRGAGLADQIDPLIVTAERLLSAARSRNQDVQSLLTLEIEIAKARLDWDAVRQAVRSSIARGATPSAKAYLALAQACWHLGKSDEADRAAVSALAIEPALAEAVVVRAYAATERGDGEAALACYRRLAELNPGTVRWSMKVIQLLNRLGRVKEAMSELEGVRERWPDDPMVRMFLRNYGPAATADGDSAVASQTAEEEELHTILRRAPDPAKLRRALVVPASDQDVMIGEVDGALSAVLVFTGSNDAVSMPLPLFDRYMAALNITVIYLKDFNRLRFLRGVQSLGDDYPSSLTALREKLSRLNAKRLCTIGNCDGGFAAIRYGIELGADRIVTFCTPTFSPDEALTRIEQARNFMRKRLAAQVPAEMMDLRGFLEGREYSAQIDLFYEENDPRDRAQALHLEGLPGVRLNPQPGLSNHYLLRRLALTSDDLEGWLCKLLGAESTAKG